MSVGNFAIAVSPMTRIASARTMTACGFLSAALTIGFCASKAAVTAIYYKRIGATKKSQRDSLRQPMDARHELPWDDDCKARTTPTGLRLMPRRCRFNPKRILIPFDPVLPQ